MSLATQITALRKKRGATLDQLSAQSEAITDRLMTDDEQKEFDKTQAEIADIDKTVERLLAAEKAIADGAREIAHPLNPTPSVEVKKFKPFPGQAFARYAGTLARAKGNLMMAVELAKRFDNETPEVGAVLRAAVAAGTTTDPAWAGPLVQYNVMASEFIEYLRPQTLFGRLPDMVPVPFMTKIPRQISGATANWVGEGISKPISALAFDMVTIPFAKMVSIVVITDELARLSTPSAEMLVRDDLAATIAQYMDQQFIDRTVAPIAGVRPGSITNGNTTIPSSGSSVAHVTSDLVAATQVMSDANIPMARPAWIMHTHAYNFLYTMRTSIDSFAFQAEMNQGRLFGIPFVVSNNVPLAAGVSDIVLVDCAQIYLADDGQIVIDSSNEASLQMDSAPVTPPVAATVMISLWQQNMLALRAERYLFWLLRRAAASVSITGFPNPAP
jgi:HK97 family phage major capsid protein